MKKHLLAAILALCVGLTVLPVQALAEDGDTSFSLPEVTELTVTYQAKGTEQTVSLLQSQPQIALTPDSRPVFTVSFDSSQRLGQVFITSTREGEVKYLEALPASVNTYVTSGCFDREDTAYLPGTIGVMYTKKVIDITRNPVIAPDIDMSAIKSELEEQGIWMEGDITTEEDGTIVGQIIFGASLGVLDETPVNASISKLYVTDEPDEYDMREWFGQYYDYIFNYMGDCSTYQLTGADGRGYVLYWTEGEWEGIPGAMILLYDLEENSYTRLILTNEMASIGGIGEVLTLVDFSGTALLEYSGIFSEVDQLLQQVRTSDELDAEQKTEAMAKISLLGYDKKMFVLAASCLPLFTGWEGPEEDPALLFSAVLNGFTSVADYVWEHRLSMVQGCPPIEGAFVADDSSNEEPEICEHTYRSSVTAPTCTEQGYTTYTCIRCGETYIAGYTGALDHSWDEWVTTKYPSAAENGQQERTCSACGLTQTSAIPATGPDIPSSGSGSGGHSNSSGSSAPSETVTTTKDSGGTSAVTTLTPSAVISGNTAAVTVSFAGAGKALNQVQSGKSGQVVIAPEVPDWVHRVKVSIPGSFLSQIGSLTQADLVVRTPAAQVTVPNAGLMGLSGGTVTLTTNLDQDRVECSISTGTQVVDRIPGGITLVVPMDNPAPGAAAVLLRSDGTRQVIRKSVVHSGNMTIPLSGSATLEIVDNTKRFFDVPGDNWAFNAVAYASSHELFNGTGDGTFAPDASMTRGMLAVVLHNLENTPPASYGNIFLDVSASGWNDQAIAWAFSEGIVSGYGDGLFGPDDNITREQLAVMLWRYAGSPMPVEKEMLFSDIDKAGNYSLDALRWAVENGIISGYTDNRLGPNELATRAQTAQMLKNFAESWALRVSE